MIMMSRAVIFINFNITLSKFKIVEANESIQIEKFTPRYFNKLAGDKTSLIVSGKSYIYVRINKKSVIP